MSELVPFSFTATFQSDPVIQLCLCDEQMQFIESH